MSKILSVYEYLGNKAGGKKLGKLINDYAKIRKIKVDRKFIKNKTYTGWVNVYDYDFLNEFFSVSTLFDDHFTQKIENFDEINTQLNNDTIFNFSFIEDFI